MVQYQDIKNKTMGSTYCESTRLPAALLEPVSRLERGYAGLANKSALVEELKVTSCAKNITTVAFVKCAICYSDHCFPAMCFMVGVNIEKACCS